MTQSQVRQAVILCGGIGSRLGELTKNTPKPLLHVGGRPFLAILLNKLRAEGIEHFLLLAAFESDQIKDFADHYMAQNPDIRISVAVEPGRVGTGGALWHARSHLEDSFYLLNGDSWLDAPVRELDKILEAHDGAYGVLSLRHVEDRARYGSVEIEGDLVTTFGASDFATGPGYINGGVYLFTKDIIPHLPQDGSLEGETLPKLCAGSKIHGIKRDCYFIDIGVVEDFNRAQIEVV